MKAETITNIPKHWPLTVTTTVQEDGRVFEKEVDNIDTETGTFLIDQVYMFPMNESLDESVTVQRCVIPAGTCVEEGYAEVRRFLEHFGCCPIVDCPKLGMPELIGGIGSVV